MLDHTHKLSLLHKVYIQDQFYNAKLLRKIHSYERHAADISQSEHTYLNVIK